MRRKNDSFAIKFTLKSKNCNFLISAYVLYSYKFELLLKLNEQNIY